jgi:two-component system response regulator
MISKTDKLTILLVEDNAGDVYMVREAMVEAGLSPNLHVVQTGTQAMDFLHRRGAFSSFPQPDLVILDLNLPAKPGQEVMAEIEATPSLRNLPIAVFTTSQSESDICARFPRLRSMFALKTPMVSELVEIVKSFDLFARTA